MLRFWLHNASTSIVKRGVCYRNVCPSVCASCLSCSWSRLYGLCIAAQTIR